MIINPYSGISQQHLHDLSVSMHHGVFQCGPSTLADVVDTILHVVLTKHSFHRVDLPTAARKHKGCVVVLSYTVQVALVGE